ncbi:uncharacterized protein LOC124112373 [Haliotis rufescens]|uniref:uncharacterized protein LOC124112373 n=1 Tax=Haliotis rufescens TaxID=6454 RepID=UPI00201EF0CD|nr:uncharacterized protein LOC124112373 [Haliotis rufescens]
MLHVISVQYQNMTPSCESPPGASCVFLQETQADSLYTDCNGVATCQMEVQKFWVDNVCGETTTYQATISYECVSDDPVDVCDNVTQLSSTDDSRLYLALPNYPHGTSSAADTCTCDVTGGDMNVTVLEYYFRPVQGVSANLTLTGDTTTWESFTAGILAYNSLVMGNTDRLRIVFDPIPASGKKKESMWLKVEGSSPIQVTCNGSPLPTTTPDTASVPGSFPSLSTSHTTVAVARSSTDSGQGQPEYGDDDNVLAVVSSVCGVVIVVLLVIVVTLIFYIKVIKHSRNTAASPDQTNEEPTYKHYNHVTETLDNIESSVPASGEGGTVSPTAIYTGLSPYTNQDHEYGKLHLYSDAGSETTVRAEDTVIASECMLFYVTVL